MQMTVLLATRNRLPVLKRTLAALAAQSVGDHRVVVVDDGSDDGTWEWLERYAREAVEGRIVALRQEHRGQGQARNLGLREIEQGLVVFIGDDTLPRPDFLAAHLSEHRHAEHRRPRRPLGVVGFTDWLRGEQRVTPLMEMVNREGHQFGYAHMTAGEEVPFTCFYTSNLSLPRRLLGEDPFAPEFARYGWEDIELGYRLSRSGLRLVYQPAAVAEHLHPTDLASFFARQQQVGHGLHTLLVLHPELEGSPHLSPIDPPAWFPLARRLLPPLVPWLSRLDALGFPLPRPILHRILMCGYYLGWEEPTTASGEEKRS